MSNDTEDFPNHDELLSKQHRLLTLYESIRSDYVSLFQHLYEIDSQAVGSLDEKVVNG